jgi:hypothetical protein
MSDDTIQLTISANHLQDFLNKERGSIYGEKLHVIVDKGNSVDDSLIKNLRIDGWRSWLTIDGLGIHFNKIHISNCQNLHLLRFSNDGVKRFNYPVVIEESSIQLIECTVSSARRGISAKDSTVVCSDCTFMSRSEIMGMNRSKTAFCKCNFMFDQCLDRTHHGVHANYLSSVLISHCICKNQPIPEYGIRLDNYSRAFNDSTLPGRIADVLAFNFSIGGKTIFE